MKFSLLILGSLLSISFASAQTEASIEDFCQDSQKNSDIARGPAVKTKSLDELEAQAKRLAKNIKEMEERSKKLNILNQ